MFDPGLLLALDHIPSSIPQPPVLPIEQVLTSPRAAFGSAVVEAEIERARARLKAWDASMQRLMERLYAAPQSEWADDVREKLDQTIGFFEDLADGLARASSREEKRAQKVGRKLPADLAHSHRNGMRLILAFEQERIERVLSLVLQFRAFRSTLAPDAGKGPVFDNSADLAAYLDDALHA